MSVSPKRETSGWAATLLATVVVFLVCLTSTPVASGQGNDVGPTRTKSVQVGSGQVTIEYPVNDPEWLDWVERTLIEDLPVLEELIGSPWPRLRLTIRQEANLVNAWGRYSSQFLVIDMDPNAGHNTLLHELSHAWFNHDGVDEIWMIEGMAEEYASRAVEATTGVLDSPTPPDLSSPYRIPLSTWTRSAFDQNPMSLESTVYQYNASWWVVRSITNEIGIDAMSQVFAELDVGGRAERSERYGDPGGWRELFNALEGRMDPSKLDALLGTYVLAPTSQIEHHRDVMKRFEQIFEGVVWQPPFALNEALDEWYLFNADELLDWSEGVVPVLDEHAAASARLNITNDDLVQQQFETATSLEELDAARQAIEDELVEIASLEEARAAIRLAAEDNDLVVEFTSTSVLAAGKEVEELETALAELDEWSLAVAVHAEAELLDVVFPPGPDFWDAHEEMRTIATQAEAYNKDLQEARRLESEAGIVVPPRSESLPLDEAVRLVEERTATAQARIAETRIPPPAVPTVFSEPGLATRDIVFAAGLGIIVLLLLCTGIVFAHQRQPGS